MRSWRLLLTGCLFPAGMICAGASYSTNYFGLYIDENHSVFRFDGAPGDSAEMWIWCLLGSNGMRAVEFAIQYPANIIKNPWWAYATINPDITIAQGDKFTTGISAGFGTCHTGWTWVAHQQIVLRDTTYSEVNVIPHPTAGALQIATCQAGMPIEPAMVLNRLYINCSSLSNPGPVLSSVYVLSSSSLVAIFDEALSGAWAVEPHHFRVFSNTIPPDTLEVLSTTGYSLDNSVLITVAENLIPACTYTLEAEGICQGIGGWCGCICEFLWCSDSEMEFTVVPVAALLQDYSTELLPGGVEVSWRLSAADDGISFLPMRLVEGSSAYEALNVEVADDGRLGYRILDAATRPGLSYRYRVDYLSGAESHTLFETDWIETPSARSFLSQNVPNPFNPTTRIAFGLAEPAAVSLRIFDVSGKLVRTLIDARLEAGSREAVWDGRDEIGQPVSTGIYLYRLQAGAFMETKKMVLVR